MDSARIDFQQLRIKHILYKSKVRSALYGGTYDPTFFSAQGPLGTWFTSIGLKKYGEEPQVRELLMLQGDLDSTVNRLATLYGSGQLDQAQEGLSGIEGKSERFLQLVSELENRLGT